MAIFNAKISLSKEKNPFAKNGIDYPLIISVDGDRQFCLVRFDEKPSKDQLKDCKEIILRTIEFYEEFCKRKISVPKIEIQEKTTSNGLINI